MSRSRQLLKGDYKTLSPVLQAPVIPFPVEVFPDRIQNIISATNESLNFPVDFLGTAMLYATSVAIGNTHRVEVKKGRIESAILYFAVVGPPGANKSHPVNFAVAPIRSRDEVSHRVFIQDKKEYEKLLNQTKKQRDSKGEPVKPIFRKFLVSDSTPESLADSLQYNKRGLGACVDELASLYKNFNRYNKGSGEQFLLTVYSAQPITIDRKTSEPIYIPQPFLSIIGTIQNGVLPELAGEGRSQNGFIDRFLFAMQEGLQRPYWSEVELDPIHAKNWNATLSKIMDIPLNLNEISNPDPEILSFTAEAKSILVEWIDDNTDRINNADNPMIQGIYSKLENNLVRLALILEMLSYGCGESAKSAISAPSANGAVKLIEYFRNTSLRVHSLLNKNNPVQPLPGDKKELYKALPDDFTTAEGLVIASSLNIPERTYKRLLTKPDLFKCIKHGQYQKIIP